MTTYILNNNCWFDNFITCFQYLMLALQFPIFRYTTDLFGAHEHPLTGVSLRPDVRAPGFRHQVLIQYARWAGVANTRRQSNYGWHAPTRLSLAQLMHSHAPQTPTGVCVCVWTLFGFGSVSIQMSRDTCDTCKRPARCRWWCHAAAGSRVPYSLMAIRRFVRVCMCVRVSVANVAFEHLV